MKKVLFAITLCAGLLFLTACGSNSLNVNKTKSDKYNELSYEVPEGFNKQSREGIQELNDSTKRYSEYEYEFIKEGSNGKFDDGCYLTFSYDTYSRDYTLERYADIFSEGKKGISKTINGVEWYIVKDDTEPKMIEYEYYAKYNNKYYNVSYSDWGSGNLCAEALPIIENSLRFSK